MVQHPNVQYIRYYTDGSAARKLEIAVPHRKGHLPTQKKVKRKNLYIDPVAIFGVFVAICMMVTMIVALCQLRSTQKEAALMEQYVAQLTREQEQLTLQYHESYDLKEIERTALALGMVPDTQAAHTQITISVPEEIPEATLWENIGTFLTGLFA